MGDTKSVDLLIEKIDAELAAESPRRGELENDRAELVHLKTWAERNNYSVVDKDAEPAVAKIETPSVFRKCWYRSQRTLEILESLSRGERQCDIARRLGVSQQLVHAAKKYHVK